MSNESGTPRPRHYIIVVHGIGEQRHNETTVEVVNRFATARAKPTPEFPYAALLPGTLSSLSMRRKGGGQGWSEFEGIPVEPRSVSAAFDGTRATITAGKNFRFVDMRWADILQEHHRVFSSSTKQWTGSLLARLQPPFTPPKWSTPWVLPLLGEIKQTLLPIQGLLKRYSDEIEKTVFQDVIGDIHLYGDYARTRGQAVRRFHTVMDEIHLRDYVQWCRFERTSAAEDYVPPLYTIIAHSLGSVLSYDALVYAFAKESIRDGTDRHESGCLPFPGYTEREDSDQDAWLGLLAELMRDPRRSDLPRAAKNWADFSQCYSQFGQCHGANMPNMNGSPIYREIPLLLWRNHVKNFITLGSPIDKFHTLWHHNYRHMGLSHHSFSPAWSDNWLDDSLRHRITHYNLCDEQDPVGHHLDTTLECPNYSKVFNTSIPVACRDVVFRRYSVPGMAHVQYWKDQALFDRVISEVIDESPASPGDRDETHVGQFISKDFIEVAGVYDMALIWAYARIPLIASVITGLLLSYGWIGWWYRGFSPSSAFALLTGILLWTCPRPFDAYRREAKTEYIAGQNGLMRRVLPWQPRRGIFANVVAGSVAWRRILILLNAHPHQAFDANDAKNRNVRLSLKTAGNFNRVFRRRILGGIVVLLLASAWIWGGGRHLSASVDNVAGPPVWYIATLVLLTVTMVYLCCMTYVGYIFKKMKKTMAPAGMSDSPSTFPASQVT